MKQTVSLLAPVYSFIKTGARLIAHKSWFQKSVCVFIFLWACVCVCLHMPEAYIMCASFSSTSVCAGSSLFLTELQFTMAATEK